MSSSIPPQISASDFERVNRLGDGASGEVWRVRPSREIPTLPPEEFLALKIYKPDILEEPNQRMRIAEEYKTGKTLVHPNLVKIYHVDIEAADQPFLVMEWCDGDDLMQWRQKNPLPTEQFLIQFATQMLDALDFLHSSRRLHRDVKPKNINIDRKGVLRLLDYGIIRSLRERSFTEDSPRFVGTYRYAAPEYIFQNSYSFSSDLYSLGAVFYFLLHGKEIFPAIQRTPDLLKAKETQRPIFEDNLERNGPGWKALMDLSKRMLEPDPANRPASAMACRELLAKDIPSVPFRGYFACALTRSNEDDDPNRRELRKQQLEQVSKVIKSRADRNGVTIYFPGEHTHPQGAPDLKPPEVYWIDRERVASADLLVVFADEPSFGVGQECEIAANAGVPIVIFHSSDIKVSRMLEGIAGRIIAKIAFENVSDLANKANQFFEENRSRLNLSRLSREREYHLRLGNRVREFRLASNLSIENLADKADVPLELMNSLESRPEQLTNLSLVNLRRIARALRVSPAELVRDQSARDQEFEDLRNASITNLREYARQQELSYKEYARLKTAGLDALIQQSVSLAAKGTPKAIDEEAWRKFHHNLIEERPNYDQGDALSDD